MDKSAVVKIVDRFHQGIKARGIRPIKLILYGSYASSTNWKESDIDIVVISDDFIAPIEAVAMTQEEWDHGDLFVIDFARNGEVLFAA